MYFVYALVDPRTDAVGYVGITNNAYERFKEHINRRGDNGKKDIWIQQFKDEKVMPAMKILEVVDSQDLALEREEYWIHHYKEQGATLVNIQLLRRREKINPVRKTLFTFSSSTLSDLWAEFTIARELYDEDDTLPYKRLLEWHEVNNEIFMSLKENNKVIAYSRLIPLQEHIIRQLLEYRIREQDIPADAIGKWTEPQLSVYVSTVTIKSTESLIKDRERGRKILKYTLDWALSLDHQFDIKRWYGIGITKKGQELFEHLGFAEISSLFSGKRKGYSLENTKEL